MNFNDFFEIIIAGITIRFHTSHQSDLDCLEGIFMYHKSTNDLPYENGKIVHNVIFSSGRFDLPVDIIAVWEGYVNTEYNITTRWYNSTLANENFITIGKDIIIHQIPEKNLSVIYLIEKKYLLRRASRPKINIYIFLLIHSILSKYNRYSLHSSCIAKNGLAYLFLGKSGNGKTTIATTLGKEGFHYMGDDMTFISRDENGEIVVDSFLHSAKIINENIRSKSVVKDIIDVIKTYQFTHSYHQKLGAIFLLKREVLNGKSTLLPVSQGDVYAWLIHSGNNIKMQYNPQLWLDICGQATTLPCYSLLYCNKEYFNAEIFNDVMI